jgi:hypothetical protein
MLSMPFLKRLFLRRSVAPESYWRHQWRQMERSIVTTTPGFKGAYRQLLIMAGPMYRICGQGLPLAFYCSGKCGRLLIILLALSGTQARCD